MSASTSPVSSATDRQTQTVLSMYRSVRSATERLASPLSAEDQMVQSCAEASPTKWHQAHTSWFFETFVLREFLPGYKPFHADFGWLFNSYYVTLGEEIPEKKLRASFSRPPLDQILAFRRHVDEAMARLLAKEASEDALRRIVLGLNHEQQHQELALYDIKNAFFVNPLHPAYSDSAAQNLDGTAPALTWSRFEGGVHQTGYALNLADPTDFCFDNETPRHRVFVEPFALANRLTTCREYLDFIADNGYTRAELWLSEGWETVRSNDWEAPLYWKRDTEDAAGWRVFTLGGWRGLSQMLDSPVCHVSLFEADAFARWSGKRLPTEAEYEVAAGSLAIEGNLLEKNVLHPIPATAAGLTQLFGDCWQWTSSAYTGYPGYKPLPGALGEYNGKFMSSQMILRGGSCVTPAAHLRITYRNFFTPATRWQVSGIRLAEGAAE